MRTSLGKRVEKTLSGLWRDEFDAIVAAYRDMLERT